VIVSVRFSVVFYEFEESQLFLVVVDLSTLDSEDKHQLDLHLDIFQLLTSNVVCVVERVLKKLSDILKTLRLNKQFGYPFIWGKFW
jgi:hypothetical protein